MKNKAFIWWLLFMAFYAIAGWHQRGFIDWYGLGAVTVLSLPLIIIYNRKEKEARSQRRNASR